MQGWSVSAIVSTFILRSSRNREGGLDRFGWNWDIRGFLIRSFQRYSRDAICMQTVKCINPLDAVSRYTGTSTDGAF